jgi:hypothetical protein
MNKYFREVIVKNALEVKHSAHISGGFADALLEESPALRAQFKNVCAPIPLELNEKLETVTQLLHLSKRDFLTLAIASAIDETNAMLDDIDIDEYLVEQAEREAARQPTLKAVQ